MKRLFQYAAIGFAALIVVILATNFSIFLGTKAYIYQDLKDMPSTGVVLIPGAAIYADGSLSSIFRDRVDAAVRVYMAGKVSKILVSGDNSTDSHNEVNPVRLYLLGKGIPDEDIFLDHAGFDTYSSMYRARDIFGVSTVLIATQSFHLPRSLFIARSLGLQAYGVNADVGNIPWKNNLREALADEKAVFDVVTLRKPKYLGNTIPVMGDGRLYP